LVKELEAYTINVTLPIVLPFGALLTPDPLRLCVNQKANNPVLVSTTLLLISNTLDFV